MSDQKTDKIVIQTTAYSSSVLLFKLQSWFPFLVKAAKMSTLILGGFSTLLLLGIYHFQSHIIYPAGLNDGHGTVDTPDLYGMHDYEAIDLETLDGETLKAFVVRQNPKAPNYSNKTVVVLCPNAGNIGHYLSIVKLFYAQMNCNVVIYSYRGYGHSTGKASEKGLKIDADTVMKYISEDEQLSKSSLILYGRSLGGAVAIYIASNYPSHVHGIILENTFLSIRKVIPYILPLLGPVSFMCHQIWDSESAIAKIPSNIPMCFMSAKKDEIVPPAHITSLHQLSKSEYKEWHEFPNSTHNDTVIQEEYWEKIADFIRDKVAPYGR
ncbi:hypothetical protein LJB42_003354 [Komagataella kurtzmanii]|nr:hypothetical protein LJB42_003354 [Komagataella kurtzmanii]